MIVSWNAQKGQNPRFKTDLARVVIGTETRFRIRAGGPSRSSGHQTNWGIFRQQLALSLAGRKNHRAVDLSYVPPARVQPMPSKHKEFFVTAPKLSLVTEYPLANGQSLLAVNVHLLAFERWGTTGIGSQLEDLTGRHGRARRADCPGG